MLCGPGIAVFTVGLAGSSGKNGASPEGSDGFAAAAPTCRRWMGENRGAKGRSRAAVRREAILLWLDEELEDGMFVGGAQGGVQEPP